MIDHYLAYLQRILEPKSTAYVVPGRSLTLQMYLNLITLLYRQN